ncbi:transporter substrate-binding domain-containing protein [Streptosporangium sp. NPDC002721]|uniref:transporter substrate-binding domain-containing protein n=1 Tax=Streptosporangium sp. NPDC002721 TaxID=3366188 RepID=UPI00369F8C37
MAKEPADGEKRPEGVSSPPETSESPKAPESPERRGRSSRRETGSSRETGSPREESRAETGGPAGDASYRRSGEQHERDRSERDRRDDDRYDPDERSERDRPGDDRRGRGRPSHGPYERDRRDDRYDRYDPDGRYERDRRDDDRYDPDGRSDNRYERDRWDDDRYDRDPRSEDAHPGAPVSPPRPSGRSGPTGPPGPSGPPRRRRFRRFRLAAWIALVLAAVVVGVSVAWVSGPPTEAELREKAGLLNKDRLLVGVKEDTPGIALRKPGETGFNGFDIDIAYMIAADLGFRPDQVDFLSIESEDRARMQARDTDGAFVKVDLVVATFSVTPERRTDPSVGFSTPYLYTEQSVVTRADYPDDNVASLGQLEGERVCSLGASTSLVELKKAIKVDPIAELLISKCVDRLADGLPANRAADAVTTDAALLAGFVAEPGRKLRHHDIALEKTEMWAVNAGSNGALRTLVDLALYRSYADPDNKEWEEAYEKHIRPLLAANPGVDVAQARQPCALPPEVRRWPWERTLPVQDCPSAP